MALGFRKKKKDKPVFKRLRDRLSGTRKAFSSRMDKIFSGKKKIDDDMLEDLEELLITSDIGVQISMEVMESISKQVNKNLIQDTKELKLKVQEKLLELLPPYKPSEESNLTKPHIIMIVGVNGVGKTTTIGKLAARYINEGKKVLIAASDTFRAAAVEQLKLWADHVGADIVCHREGADPSAVAFDAVQAAVARNVDIVLIDTAGRLHTKSNLMEEIKKIRRTIAKKMPDAPHEILLILDATTGQNAVTQAQTFHEALNITGIALTKLDGTAKGGIIISIYNSLQIPLKYIGIGEQAEDLQDFDAEQFIKALF
ncbi:Signal recognition particle receptor FtsY [Candidatus Magnetomoraceae bacterium gMMP-1]